MTRRFKTAHEGRPQSGSNTMLRDCPIELFSDRCAVDASGDLPAAMKAAKARNVARIVR